MGIGDFLVGFGFSLLFFLVVDFGLLNCII